jgi:membrane protein
MPSHPPGDRGAPRDPIGPRSGHGSESPLAELTELTETIRVRLLHVLGLGGVPPWVLAQRVIAAALRNDSFGQAAKMSYSLLFAMFPFLIFLTTLPAFLPVPNLLDTFMRGAERVVPDAALAYVQRNIQVLLGQERSGLLSITFLITVFAASSALMAVMDSLNRAYGIRERRPYWKLMGTAMLLSIGLTTFTMVAAALMLLGSQIGSLLAVHAGFGPTFHMLWTLLRWPAVVVILMVAMAAVYYYGPDLRQGWRWVTPGAIFAVIGWILASLGFSYYVRHFSRYDQLHGGFAAVIMLMTWLYLSGLFVILGGEINAKIEHGSPHGREPGHRQHFGGA